MKSKLPILLLSLLLFALQACVKDEDKVFDAPAIERVNTAISHCRTTLCGAPNGWVMEYYPETDRSLGGYYFICTFGVDGKVQVVSEINAGNNYPAGTPVTSDYDVIADESVVLTFNTYNAVMHYFVDPSFSDIDGYAGDYEFLVREVTPTRIVMTGKKHGNRIVMTSYADTPDTWLTYLKALNDMDWATKTLLYKVRTGGQEVPGIEVTNLDLYRALRITDGTGNSTLAPYIPTLTGIKLYEPATIAGKTAQHFMFNPVDETLTAVESDVVLEFADLPPNRILPEVKKYCWLTNTSRPTASTLLTSVFQECNNNFYFSNQQGQELVAIIAGDSPFGEDYPGRGFVFITESSTNEYYSQFFFDFTPVKGTTNLLEIKMKDRYSSLGINGLIYANIFEPFFVAMEYYSPYTIAFIGNPKTLSGISVTSTINPNFYFDLLY
jgi:hypothetical protein